MEEEMKTEEGDAASNEGEARVAMSKNSPTKRRRGRPQGSKKLKVCVTDVNLMELVSGISNGGSTQPQRGRGRPKISSTKYTEQQVSEDNDADNSVQPPRSKARPKVSKKQASDDNSLMTDHSPKKRGRPKKSHSKSIIEKDDVEELPNGGSEASKMGRGRPKGSTKRKSESLTSSEETEGGSVAAKKRGRPKGSLNNPLQLGKDVGSEGEPEADGGLNSLKRGRFRLRKMEANNSAELAQSTSNGILKRGRGRPRKNVEQEDELVTDGSQPPKRGRGRPKGSLNKKPSAYWMVQSQRVLVPPTAGRRGRPRKEPAKRGRPRKYPPPSPEELKKPKVWKPLGRPRKYPRVDPPEGAPPAPRRSRGRPRKSASKKGAHLRKSWPTAPSSPRTPKDGFQRKRGRPPSTPKSVVDTPRKRGRPKGSLNKNKASALPNHSKSDSSAFEGLGSVTVAHRSNSEETLDRDTGFEVSDQA